MHNVHSPDLETEIATKANKAPRVTPADLDAAIKSVVYINAGQAFMTTSGFNYPPEINLLTFCILVLNNGFTVTGESACASPENFNQEIGQKVAYANAKEKLWPLLGFALKEQLSRAKEA